MLGYKYTIEMLFGLLYNISKVGVEVDMSKKFKLYLIIGILLVSTTIIVLGRNNKLYEYGSAKENASFYAQAFDINIWALFEDFVDNMNDLDKSLKNISNKGYFTEEDFEDIKFTQKRIRERFKHLSSIRTLKQTGKKEKNGVSLESNIAATSVSMVIYDIKGDNNNNREEKYEINEKRKIRIDMLTKTFQEIRELYMLNNELAKEDNWIKYIDKMEVILNNLDLKNRNIDKKI